MGAMMPFMGMSNIGSLNVHFKAARVVFSFARVNDFNDGRVALTR